MTKDDLKKAKEQQTKLNSELTELNDIQKLFNDEKKIDELKKKLDEKFIQRQIDNVDQSAKFIGEVSDAYIIEKPVKEGFCSSVDKFSNTCGQTSSNKKNFYETLDGVSGADVTNKIETTVPGTSVVTTTDSVNVGGTSGSTTEITID